MAVTQLVRATELTLDIARSWLPRWHWDTPWSAFTWKAKISNSCAPPENWKFSQDYWTFCFNSFDSVGGCPPPPPVLPSLKLRCLFTRVDLPFRVATKLFLDHLATGIMFTPFLRPPNEGESRMEDIFQQDWCLAMNSGWDLMFWYAWRLSLIRGVKMS